MFELVTIKINGYFKERKKASQLQEEGETAEQYITSTALSKLATMEA